MRLLTVLVPLVALIVCAAWPVTGVEPHQQLATPGVELLYPNIRYTYRQEPVARVITPHGSFAYAFVRSREGDRYFTTLPHFKVGGGAGIREDGSGALFERNVLDKFHQIDEPMLVRLKALSNDAPGYWSGMPAIMLDRDPATQMSNVADYIRDGPTDLMDSLAQTFIVRYSAGDKTYKESLNLLSLLANAYVGGLKNVASAWNFYWKQRYPNAPAPKAFFKAVKTLEGKANHLEQVLSSLDTGLARMKARKRTGLPAEGTSRAAEEVDGASGQVAETAEEFGRELRGFRGPF